MANEPDVIELRGLRLNGLCGLLPEELTRRQPLEFDVDVFVSSISAFESDDLDDTVDYGQICERLDRLIADEKFMLLERLANRAAELVLEMPGVLGVRLSVRKLRPPVPQQLASSGVRVTRWGQAQQAGRQ